jgi:hypothetical protein
MKRCRSAASANSWDAYCGALMPSRTEEILSCALWDILAKISIGANIPDTAQFQPDVLVGLEYWLPDIFGEVYPEWNGMTLDGIYPAVTRKTGDGEAEILGQCIFIEDQTLALILLRIQIAPVKDEVSWLECKIGERLVGRPGEKGEQGMVRLPYSEKSLNANSRRMLRLDRNVDQIDWVYQVTFGKRVV